MNVTSAVATGPAPAVTSNAGFSNKCSDAIKDAIKMIGDFFASIPGFVMRHPVAVGAVVVLGVLCFAAYYFAPSESTADDTGPTAIAGANNVKQGKDRAHAHLAHHAAAAAAVDEKKEKQ